MKERCKVSDAAASECKMTGMLWWCQRRVVSDVQPSLPYNAVRYFSWFTNVSSLLWPPYGIGQAIIFLPCGFFYLLLSFFPCLISAATDWISTILPHMMWP